MVTYAAIPTLGRSLRLVPLLQDLMADLDVDEVRLYDNGMPTLGRALAAATGVTVVDAHRDGLYKMWNDAIDWARSSGADLALLNDDIALTPGTIDAMVAALHSAPAIAVVGTDHLGLGKRGEVVPVPCTTYRNGGIGGWAFVVDPANCPTIDEGFKVWFGDDDLFWKIAQQGRTAAVAGGVVVDHDTSTTVGSLDWVPAAIAQDRARWAALGRDG